MSNKKRKADDYQDNHHVALRVIQGEQYRANHMRPPMKCVLISWRGKIYLGGYQRISPEFSREIVYLTKTTNSIEKKLAKAIMAIDSSRMWLEVDSEIDLEGRGHVMRLLGSFLASLTPEQTSYVVKHPPSVVEI